MNRPLKIGIASDAILPTIDGVSNTAENYAVYLNKNHGEAVMLAPYNPNRQGVQYPYPLYTYKSWPLSPSEGYRVGWPFKMHIREELRKLDVDLYHSHCPLASSYLIKLATEKQNVPTVLTYHTKYEYDIQQRVPTKKFRTFARNFILNNINRADEVWVTSKGTGDSLRKMGYSGSFVVMPNGVDMEKGRAGDAETAAVYTEYGLSRDVPLLLYVGRVMWYKNFQLILDALVKLEAEGQPFQLLVAGIGMDAKAIRRYARKSGLSDRVVFAGKISDRQKLKAFYSAADLFLFPSTFDTNGLVVGEAAACSCPSLLVRGSCAAENCTDRDNAILCDETPESMARTLLDVIARPDLLKQVGTRAAETLYLSWEDAVAMAYQRYEALCAHWDYERENK